MIQIGRLYKVVKDDTCCQFTANPRAKFVQFSCWEGENDNTYVILDEWKRVIAMCSDCFEEGDVELVDEYVEGDILIDDDDDELCVLGVCGKTYLMSEFNDPEGAGNSWTRKDLDNSGFALKSSLTQPKEMTVEEISKKLGHPVKVVKG